MSEPFSMAEGAVALHEMFTSYIDAGFTENQALQITIALVTAGAGKDPS